MVTKDRRAQARRRAHELQKEEADRLARMQSARTDAFIALEALDDALESFGLALDKLLDEGEKKRKLAVGSPGGQSMSTMSASVGEMLIERLLTGVTENGSGSLASAASSDQSVDDLGGQHREQQPFS